MLNGCCISIFNVVILYITAIHKQFLHFSVMTVAREFRKDVRQTVAKTIAHRKQVRVCSSQTSNAQEDEMPIEPHNESVCAGCRQESVEDVDDWIQCDRFVLITLSSFIELIYAMQLRMLLLLGLWLCCSCEDWYHHQCTDLSTSQFAQLREAGESGRWECAMCDSF